MLWQMLKKTYLIDVNANRNFLLQKTQHLIGGFAKLPQPGTPPGKFPLENDREADD